MTMKETRIALLKQMNDYVLENCENEILVEQWFTFGVPDNPSEDDFEFIAEEYEIFTDVCNTYAGILKREGIV